MSFSSSTARTRGGWFSCALAGAATTRAAAIATRTARGACSRRTGLCVERSESANTLRGAERHDLAASGQPGARGRLDDELAAARKPAGDAVQAVDLDGGAEQCVPCRQLGEECREAGQPPGAVG